MLHAIDELRQVFDLTWCPPRRIEPCARMQHDLAVAGDAVIQRPSWGISGTRRLAANAAMETDAQWPFARRIVVRRDFDGIIESDTARPQRQLDTSRLLRSVLTASPQSLSDIIEARCTRHDFAASILSRALPAGIPEGLHDRIQSGTWGRRRLAANRRH